MDRDSGRKRLGSVDTTPQRPVKVRKLMRVPELTAKGTYPLKMSCQVAHLLCYVGYVNIKVYFTQPLREVQ